MASENEKTCFVIAPIGDPESTTRKHSDQVMRHILRPAVEAVGYIAIRADEIDKPGIITSQVLSQVVDAELVIADLTERNPNVFYELAIRHATSKPFVQLIRKGETIPFDVAGTRTVIFDLHDPDSVEDARKSVTKQIEALETDSTDIETPISVSWTFNVYAKVKTLNNGRLPISYRHCLKCGVSCRISEKLERSPSKL